MTKQLLQGFLIAVTCGTGSWAQGLTAAAGGNVLHPIPLPFAAEKDTLPLGKSTGKGLTRTNPADTLPVPDTVNVLRSGLSPQDLVPTGYLGQRRKYITGSIGSLSSAAIERSVVPNFENALQGRIPGVHIIQANGMPGSDVVVRVRGTATLLGEAAPLYVLDGVPIFSGPRGIPAPGMGGGWGAAFNPLSDINPNDIASIEVLKDAAATAIYGARGAGGVVLITTKKGSPKKTDIRLDYYRGVTSPARTVNSLTGRQYLQLLDESWVNSGNTGTGPLPTVNGFTRERAEATHSDHLNQVLRQGMVQQVSLSASAGSEKTTFYISGSYRKETGIVTGNDFERATGRINISNDISEKLTLGANVGLNIINYTSMPVGYGAGGGFNAAQTNLPVFPWYNEDQTYFNPYNPRATGLPGSNVAAYQDKNQFDNEQHVSRTFIQAFAAYKIIPGLTFRSDAALDMYFHSTRDYLSKRIRTGSLGSGAGREGQPTAYASFERNSVNGYNLNNTLTYTKAVRNHGLTALGGIHFYYSENPHFFFEGEGFTNDFSREPHTASYRNTRTASSLVTNKFAFLAYFANANYAFKDRYLVGATVRTEGSSRFGANRKYATFPAVSVGWVVSDEAFLQQNKTINFLKIRASYGKTGNAGMDNYAALEQWNLTADSRYLNQPGVQYQSLGNPNLTGETQHQLDVGLDFAVLHNRLRGTVDFYDKKTRDLLLRYATPLSAGITDQGLLLNAGKLRNRGLELGISSSNIVSGSFQWHTDFTVAHNRNKVLSTGGLAPGQITPHGNIGTYEGHPLGTFYLAEWAGVDPDTGAELIYDGSGNKVPALSAAQVDEARVPQFDKPSAPRFFGGLNNMFTLKGFDLSVLVTFAYGNWVLDEGERFLSYVRGDNNLRAEAYTRWTADNPDTGYPRLLFNDPIAGRNTTRFLHDASYLRIKNVTLGYAFAKALPKRLLLSNARIYLTAQNLFTFTRFPGWDPEVAGNPGTNLDRSLGQGITYLEVPQVRTFVAGITLSF